MEQFGFWVIFVHPGLMMMFVKSGSMFLESNMSWVYGYDPESKLFHYFPSNENPTRPLNTTSLKFCLPLTDAIDRREKFMHAYEGSRSAHESALH